tara:strand:- start:1883 stop:2821 length:939 start_codon:yes stop_codon:yes gene_type:complete
MATLIPDALSDLNRIRELQTPSATNPAGDNNLYIRIINFISQYALTETHRPSFKYASITDEYHNGLGHIEVAVKYWPIVTLTSIFDDTTRNFTSSTELTYADAPATDDVRILEPNRQLIERLDANFGNGQGNVKITYTSGFSHFIVQAGVNDQITFTDSAATYTTTLTEAKYNAVSLASHISTQMNTDASDTITIAYSTVSHRYSIASDGSLTINWDASDRVKGLAQMLGFNDTADDTGATTYYGDYPAIGIPEDLASIVDMYVLWAYESTKERRTGKFSSDTSQGSSMSFDYTNVPDWFTDVLNSYIIREL